MMVPRLRSAFTGILSDWFVIRLARRNHGIYEPEQRLWLFAVTTIVVPASLILWGVGVSSNPSFASRRLM